MASLCSTYLGFFRLFSCFCRKNWNPSWVVLVGNSLVFFKDPKSQNPDSWVRLISWNHFRISCFKSEILLNVCLFTCRSRGTAVRRAAWIWEELSFSGPTTCPAKKTSSRWERDFLLKQMSSQTCQDTKICNQISKHFYFPKETLHRVKTVLVCFWLSC